MSMRRGNSRELAGLPDGPVEIASQLESRHGLEQDLLDRVALTIEASEDLGMQRSAFRQWQQTSRRENLLPQVRGPRLPFGERLLGRHLEMRASACVGNITNH